MKVRIESDGSFSLDAVVFIYALCEPATKDVRYIGRAFDVAQRYKQHLKSPCNAKLAAWIASLDERGLRPLVRVLQRVYGLANGRAAERAVIEQHVQAGCSLLNSHMVLRRANWSMSPSAALRQQFRPDAPAAIAELASHVKPCLRQQVSDKIKAGECLMCEGKSKTRGLCRKCYAAFARAMQSLPKYKHEKAVKHFTWKGMLLPPQAKAGVS